MFDGDVKNDMLHILFDKRWHGQGCVALSWATKKKSKRSKNKKKIHIGRKHSWDDKVAKKFILLYLLMQLANQYHITVSTTTRSSKFKKKL